MDSINLAKTATSAAVKTAGQVAGVAANSVKVAATFVKRDLRPLRHVENALTILRAAKVPMNISTADNPLVKIMIDLEELGETEVVAITRTLAQSQNFNTMISEQAGKIKVGERHLAIAERFNSVREDAANMARVAQTGKRGVRDNLQQWWMEKRRGSIPERFQGIASDAQDVIKDTQNQLVMEKAITASYKELRNGIKEATIMAGTLRDRARAKLETAQNELREAQDTLEASDDTDMRDHLELERDLKLNAMSKADHMFQTAEDIYNNLNTSYYAGEVVITRLAQATDAKDRVQRQMQSFFSSAQTVMAGLATTLTATQGLNEAYRTLDALKDGMGKSMEALADLNSTVQKDALKSGYTSGMDVAPIQKLLDAVISYQTESREIISQARAESARNAEEVRRVVEEGRKNLVNLVQRQALESTLPPKSESVASIGYDTGADSEAIAAAETLAQLKAARAERVNIE